MHFISSWYTYTHMQSPWRQTKQNTLTKEPGTDQFTIIHRTYQKQPKKNPGTDQFTYSTYIRNSPLSCFTIWCQAAWGAAPRAASDPTGSARTAEVSRNPLVLHENGELKQSENKPEPKKWHLPQKMEPSTTSEVVEGSIFGEGSCFSIKAPIGEMIDENVSWFWPQVVHRYGTDN